ncbi:MAG TPA: ABC transporter ATP-binding protein [Candidatus Methylomirabilis sp.]|jgi:peptide/nickel transport system ATP-binding protein
MSGATARPPAEPLLAVEGLCVEFRTRDGIVKALEAVGFTVGAGETVGVVGESGSGKSVTALAVLGILPPAARVSGGRARFRGVDLLAPPREELARRRGREISMVFQSPRTALNPIRTVGRQLEDVLTRHTDLTRRQARARTVELLADVHIPDPGRRAGAYPFELSGGMCQRVMIALAVACAPALLIADEPTTGLDVTTQAEVLDLLEDLARRRGMATVLITHDLGLAAERCDRIVVMHAGHVVEIAPTPSIFGAPRHPYTAGLIASTPGVGRALADLQPIPGSVPDLRGALGPCRYRGRCPRAAAACGEPPLPRTPIGPGQMVACRFPL